MNRPVGASSTDVTMSAQARLGNGSWRSGPTSVMFRPGTLGKSPFGSPAPRGGVRGAPPGPGTMGTAPGMGGATGTGIGGVSAGGAKSLAPANGETIDGPPPAAGPGP